MKKLMLATALLAVTATFAVAEDKVVRLATEGAYPPYNLIDDKGEVGGFERFFGDEICKRAALTCTWSVNEWDSIIPNLQSGNYDVIVAAMSITDERKQVIDFTENYSPPTPSEYVATSADADCAKGVVAAQVSTIQSAYVATTGATLLEFPSGDETMAAVKNGEAACVFADADYLRPFVDESAGALVKVGEPVSIGGGIGMGLRKSDTELKAKLDAAIKSMKDDGSLNAMLKQYVGPEALTF
jgi:polar amino acid transport system substrate-binding protein